MTEPNWATLLEKHQNGIIYQLPNGKWTHHKTTLEFDDHESALLDWCYQMDNDSC